MKFSFEFKKRNDKIGKNHVFGENPEDDLNVLIEECKYYLPSFDEAMVRKAFDVCYKAHKNKLRKSGEPYYTHPLEVARIVIKEIPLDDVSVAAALLHNVTD